MRLSWPITKLATVFVLGLLLTGCILVSPSSKPAIIVVVEFDTENINPANIDANFIIETLREQGFKVTRLDEPSGGIQPQDLEPFEVIIYSQGTWSHLIQPSTPQALKAARDAGRGVIIIGDDAPSGCKGPSLAEVTKLRCLSNDGEENPRITFMATPHPVISGLEGNSFQLSSPHGDVDQAEPLDSLVQILARTNGGLPALTAHDDGYSRVVTIIWEVARTDQPRYMKKLILNAVNWVAPPHTLSFSLAPVIRRSVMPPFAMLGAQGLYDRARPR